jgi:hypothetical protein
LRVLAYGRVKSSGPGKRVRNPVDTGFTAVMLRAMAMAPCGMPQRPLAITLRVAPEASAGPSLRVSIRRHGVTR